MQLPRLICGQMAFTSTPELTIIRSTVMPDAMSWNWRLNGRGNFRFFCLSDPTWQPAIFRPPLILLLQPPTRVHIFRYYCYADRSCFASIIMMMKSKTLACVENCNSLSDSSTSPLPLPSFLTCVLPRGHYIKRDSSINSDARNCLRMTLGGARMSA